MPTILLIILATAVPMPPQGPSGEATIRDEAGGSEIVIRTTDRLAGAIDSLRWGGREFIDSADHGRQLQSACAFGAFGPGFWAESFNPTEAGSRADGDGPTSTSRLLRIRADGDTLETTTRMAFWLRPGEQSAGHPARNEEVLSDVLVSKRVRIGVAGLPHAIDYRVTFTVPDSARRHSYAQFEALTGYMPDAFSRFERRDPSTGALVPLEGPNGEQGDPVVVSTPDGGHAMGIWSPDQPSTGFEHAGYGRFRFPEAGVVKWNCVFRVREPEGIAPGEFTYQMYVVVGTREDVARTLDRLVGRAGG